MTPDQTDSGEESRRVFIRPIPTILVVSDGGRVHLQELANR